MCWLKYLVQVGLLQGSVVGPLLFFIVLESLNREIRSGSPEELLYTNDLALFSETHDRSKGRLQAWKGLQANTKKKMTISSENAGKATMEVKFYCPVCRKSVGSNSILCKF